MIFGKKKYIGLILIICLLILGYMLMSGGGSDNPEVFREEIFSFRRITLGPVIVVASYIAMIFLILNNRPVDISKKK